MSIKKTVNSTKSSHTDVYGISEVRTPTTLLDKFFLEIIDNVRSGNGDVIGRVRSSSDIITRMVTEYYRTDDRLYTDYNWVCTSSDEGDPLDNYVHEVICPSKEFAPCYTFNLTKRESLDLKCKFLSMFRNEKWFKRNVDDVVFELIDELNDIILSEDYDSTLRLDYNSVLNLNVLNVQIRSLHFDLLLNEIDSWYKVFQHSLPKSSVEQYRRVKNPFTLTNEQRNELWELLVKGPVIDGDTTHYEEFVRYFTDTFLENSIRIDSKHTSNILVQILVQLYQNNNVSEMTKIIGRVTGMTGEPNVKGNPL